MNVDVIVHAERPKLKHHKLTIRDRIAEILELSADQIGLQAKTGEGIGAVGESLAMAAQCVALLERVTSA